MYVDVYVHVLSEANVSISIVELSVLLRYYLGSAGRGPPD
jgi:hypothetical protein